MKWLCSLLVVCCAVSGVAQTFGPFIVKDGTITIDAPRFRLIFTHGCLTSIDNKLDHTIYTVDTADKGVAPSWGLVAIKPGSAGGQLSSYESPTAGSTCTVQAIRGGISVQYTGLTREDGKRALPKETLTLDMTLDTATGDLCITQRGEGAYNTTGIALGVANLRADHEYLIPAREGLLLDRTVADGKNLLAPPSMLLRFAPSLFIGRSATGAFMLWNEVPSIPYTPITYTKRDNAFAFSLLTPAQYPWVTTDRVASVTWRFNTFSSWIEPVRRYQQFLEGPAGFVPLAQRTLKWPADIYFLCQRPFSLTPSIEACKTMLRDPSCALIYGVDEIDGTTVNFQHFLDYQFRPQLTDEIVKAHEAGMRVQLYSYYNLVWSSQTEKTGQYNSLRLFNTDDPSWGKYELGYFNVNVANNAFRKALIEKYVALAKETRADSFYLDTAFSQEMNGPLVDGQTPTEGQQLFQRDFAAALPNMTLEAEASSPRVMDPVHGNQFTMTLAGKQYYGFRRDYPGYQLYTDHAFPITALLFNRFVKIHGLNDTDEGEIGHWTRDIYEKTGMCELTFIDDGYNYSGRMAVATNGLARLLREHINLFSTRKLKITLPDHWQAGVRSYFQATDNTLFAFTEIPGGSELVEQRQGKPIIHYARITGGSPIPDGLSIPGWPCLAPDGTPAGLNPQKRYCLFPNVTRPRFTVSGMPATAYLDAWRLISNGIALDLTTPEGNTTEAAFSIQLPKDQASAYALTSTGITRVISGDTVRCTIPGTLTIVTNQPAEVNNDVALLPIEPKEGTLNGCGYEGNPEPTQGGTISGRVTSNFQGVTTAATGWYRPGNYDAQLTLLETPLLLPAGSTPELRLSAGNWGCQPYTLQVCVNGTVIATLVDDGKVEKIHRVSLTQYTGKPFLLSLRFRGASINLAGPVIILDGKAAN